MKFSLVVNRKRWDLSSVGAGSVTANLGGVGKEMVGIIIVNPADQLWSAD